MDEPVPINVPLHDPEYQLQSAPVPSDPPLTESVTLLPVQTDVAEDVMPAGSVEGESTVTVTLAQPVMLQSPSALT